MEEGIRVRVEKGQGLEWGKGEMARVEGLWEGKRVRVGKGQEWEKVMGVGRV